jgi:dienelactone hydrolase
VKANARRFAAHGYFCCAPDLFYRSGERLTFDPSQMGDSGFRERLIAIVRRLQARDGRLRHERDPGGDRR